jgi:hypothetical protein
MRDARWTSDGRVAWLTDDDGLVGSVRLVDDWYEPGEHKPVTAWVVDFMHEAESAMQRALIEIGGEPAAGEERMAELSELGHAVATAGPPPIPSAFGIATTGTASTEELHDRIELTSYALQEAEGRLGEAARLHDEHSGKRVAVCLTETLSWLRSVDYLMTYTWTERVSEAAREEVSRRVDRVLEGNDSAAQFFAEARGRRQLSGEPYQDWTVPLVDCGIALHRGELQGLRWLAGKLLHHVTGEQALSLAGSGARRMRSFRARPRKSVRVSDPRTTSTWLAVTLSAR